MLEVKGLNVEVEGKEILHDVNMTIREGETHVLFGPNGVGKTTAIFSFCRRIDNPKRRMIAAVETETVRLV